MDEVEDIFVRHFAGDNRRKAMKYLKPAQRKESHAVPFFTGLATGCFAALFLGYCVMAHMAGLYLYTAAPRGRGGVSARYMETAYPVLSMFALLFLHLLLYGCNMVAWRRCRVNYGFIFASSPAAGGELRPRDVFLACAASMAAVAGVMFAHLALVLRGYHASPHVQAIPGFLLLVSPLCLLVQFAVCPDALLVVTAGSSKNMLHRSRMRITECVLSIHAGVPAPAVLPSQRRLPVESASVPQDSEEHCPVATLQGSAVSASLAVVSDQLFC